MRVLLKNGANIEALRGGDETPLMWAAQEGRLEAIDLLLEAGANVNARRLTLDGITPLLWCLPKWPVAAAHLIRHGADVTAAETMFGRSPLHLCVPHMPEIATLLVLKGADPLLRSKDGVTPKDLAEDLPTWRARLFPGITDLQREIIRGNLARVSDLLNHNRVDEKDQFGNTNLHYAAVNNRPEIAKLLLNKGARPNYSNEDVDIFNLIDQDDLNEVTCMFDANPALVNVRSDAGYPLIHWAKSQDMVRLLIAKGTQIDETDSHGNTALHNAVESGELKLAMALIECGINVKAANYAGKTATALASSAEMRSVLLEHGGERSDLIARNLAILEQSVSDTGFWDSWQHDGETVSVNLGMVQLLGKNSTSGPSTLTIELSKVSHLVFFSQASLPPNWITDLQQPRDSAGGFDGVIVRGDVSRPHISAHGFTVSDVSVVHHLFENMSPEFSLGQRYSLFNSLSTGKFIAFIAPPVGLLVVGENMQIAAGSDSIDVSEIEDACRRWWHYWRQYWNQKSSSAAHIMYDPACEATIPMAS